MRLASGGVSIEIPLGWEGQIDTGSGAWQDGASPAGVERSEPVVHPGGEVRRTVAHLANFPLPTARGDFGGGAVELMRGGDVFISLFEYGPESATTALFDHDGVPQLASQDFDPTTLQRTVPGGSAVQRFFRHSGRAFCLYVVVGSHIDRNDVVPAINTVLAELTIT
jgi:hypothetical protein